MLNFQCNDFKTLWFKPAVSKAFFSVLRDIKSITWKKVLQQSLTVYDMWCFLNFWPWTHPTSIFFLKGEQIFNKIALENAILDQNVQTDMK